VASGSGIKDLAGNDFAVDTSDIFTVNASVPAPRVTGVFVRGTGAAQANWSSSFLNYLAVNNLGDSSLGYRIQTGANQLRALPWVNVNTISVQFDQDVSITSPLTTTALAGSASAGVSVPSIAMAQFSYNSSLRTATWVFPTPLTRNKLVLGLASSGVRSASGVSLDGEWTTSSSTISGNQVAGGDFYFRINVLPGDLISSSSVNTADVNEFRRVSGSLTTSTTRPYSAFADLNGNGSINNTADTDILRAIRSASSNLLLPALDPANPVFAAAGASMMRMASTSDDQAEVIPSGIVAPSSDQLSTSAGLTLKGSEQKLLYLTEEIAISPVFSPSLAGLPEVPVSMSATRSNGTERKPSAASSDSTIASMKSMTKGPKDAFVHSAVDLAISGVDQTPPLLSRRPSVPNATSALVKKTKVKPGSSIPESSDVVDMIFADDEWF
jgi:hypothetical protein